MEIFNLIPALRLVIIAYSKDRHALCQGTSLIHTIHAKYDSDTSKQNTIFSNLFCFS